MSDSRLVLVRPRVAVTIGKSHSPVHSLMLFSEREASAVTRVHLEKAKLKVYGNINMFAPTSGGARNTILCIW